MIDARLEEALAEAARDRAEAERLKTVVAAAEAEVSLLRGMIMIDFF